jgi:hypothetical protein
MLRKLFYHCATNQGPSIIIIYAWNTKEGSITVPLTSCLIGLDESVLQIKIKIVGCHTANSKPVKREVNGTVLLPPLVIPALCHFRTPCVNDRI